MIVFFLPPTISPLHFCILTPNLRRARRRIRASDTAAREKISRFDASGTTRNLQRSRCRGCEESEALFFLSFPPALPPSYRLVRSSAPRGRVEPPCCCSWHHQLHSHFALLSEAAPTRRISCERGAGRRCQICCSAARTNSPMSSLHSLNAAVERPLVIFFFFFFKARLLSRPCKANATVLFVNTLVRLRVSRPLVDSEGQDQHKSIHPSRYYRIPFQSLYLQRYFSARESRVI